jgi:hypothetical protein
MSKLYYSIFILISILKFVRNDIVDVDDVSVDATKGTIMFSNETSFLYELPVELYENYQAYHLLEEYNKTCSFEKVFDSFTEQKLKERIIRENCIPNFKTFQNILENGWVSLYEYLVQEIYLPKLIDPTSAVYTYLKRYETQSNRFKYFLNDTSAYEEIQPNYIFENFENKIGLTIPLPDASFVLEHLSLYCYKDLLKIKGIFKSRHKLYKILESNYLFDMVDGDCEYNYNSFNHKIEISFNKLNKLKKWTSLFKQ